MKRLTIYYVTGEKWHCYEPLFEFIFVPEQGKKKCKKRDSAAICWGKEHAPHLTFHYTSSFDWYGRGCRDALTPYYLMWMKYAYTSAGERVTAKAHPESAYSEPWMLEVSILRVQPQNLPNLKEAGLIVTEINTRVSQMKTLNIF